MAPAWCRTPGQGVRRGRRRAREGVEPLECCVCLDAPALAVCVPCGHVMLCAPCGRAVLHAHRDCPTCRRGLEGLFVPGEGLVSGGSS
jgi:hypothetical protein